MSCRGLVALFLLPAPPDRVDLELPDVASLPGQHLAAVRQVGEVRRPQERRFVPASLLVTVQG